MPSLVGSEMCIRDRFTPAGILRVPLDGAGAAAEVLTFVSEKLLQPLSA